MGRKIEPTKESHSQMLSDKEILYALHTHNVKPDCVFNYLSNYRKTVEIIQAKKDELNCELIGSWKVEVGDVDQILHLWKFTGGFEKVDLAKEELWKNEVSRKMNGKCWKN